MNGKTEMVRTSWIAVILLSLLIGVAGAQAQRDEPVGQDRPIAPIEPLGEFQPRLERAGELIGAKVLDHQDKWLGTIEEIVLTPSRDTVDYAVLSYGGFWGVLEKRFAVPWSQLQVRPQDEVFVLNVDRKVLDGAEGLGKDYWPTTASENWTGVVFQPAADIQYRRLTRLAGLTVANAQGETLGQLEDFMIDVNRGGLAYAILWIPRDLPDLMDRDLAAVPWSAIEILPPSGTARLNADRQTLEALAFNARSFPNLEDPLYSRQLHDRFGATPYWQALGYVPGEPEPDTP